MHTKSRLVGCGDGLRAHREDASGAIAVQIVWSTRRGSRQIEHLASARDHAELEALKQPAETNRITLNVKADEHSIPISQIQYYFSTATNKTFVVSCKAVTSISLWRRIE